MPSRDGLLNHLHIAHLERVKIGRTLGLDWEVAAFSFLAKAHAEFHRLDILDAGLISSTQQTEGR